MKTPAMILSEALRMIPGWLRHLLLVAYALVVVLVAIGQIIDYPLEYDKINEVLVYIGGYLGVQSAANVKDPELPPGDAGIMAEV
jgi:succinate-acetate transporter protein